MRNNGEESAWVFAKPLSSLPRRMVALIRQWPSCWDIIRKNELQRNNKILCPTRDPCTRTENRRKSLKVLTLSSLKISKYSLCM
ncbi:hypothetical protein GQ457_16G020020 [Hibiscus cannabinus]